MASKRFVVVLLILASTYALPESINIGGLFHSTDDQEELVFQYSAEAISTNYTMLRRRLVPLPERVAPHDNLGVTRTVCALLEQGVAGIFGPMGGSTSLHVQSICDVMDIPHIETTWDTHHKRHDVLVNVHPHPSALGKAYMELVMAWGWRSFTVIYEDRAGLLRVNPLLKMAVKGTVTVKQLDTSGHQNHRPILRQIKNSGEKNIILDCTIESLPEVLKQAQQVGLMTSEFQFIVTCLDMHTIDVEPYQYGGTNITGLRLVDPDDLIVQLTVRRWSDLEMRRGKVIGITPETLTVKMALVHDAVNLFALALQHLNMTGAEVTPLDCSEHNNWGHGTSIINFMKAGFIQNTQRGLTGDIEFDNEGYRTNINLDVMELTEKGLGQVGTWNTLKGLNMTRVFQTSIQDGDESLQNRTFIVLTALSHPYGMRSKSSVPLKGNARFEGFGIELIHELSLMLGFNYTFELQHDNAYGSYNKNTGEWNGMIRQLLDSKADLAITDLTITSERESAADFTMPFMTLGISILYKRPTKAPPKLFSFMSPFSMDVWMCMFSVYLGVSIMLWIMGRICPYEWTNPYPCIQEPEELENQFTLKNSLWFTIGSLMQQGSEIAPIAVSTRMVAGIWWFFTLIIVSSYTANLAAFLTVESMTSPFKNVKELANQNVIQYGAKRGGSTVNFFRDSTDPMYQRMYKYMMDHQDEVLASTNEQGLEWVKSRDYAFFMESTSIEYITERHCEVSQIGDKLDSKGYGIAMRKNSTYRNSLSTAVLKLQESGKLSKMKNRWWKEERGGGKCADSGGSGNPSPLSLANVGGVFVVLVCGSVMACFFAVFELLVNVFETSRREKVSFKEELMSELRFIARCHGTTKPVHKYHQDEGSESHTVGEEGNFVGIYSSTPYPFNGNNIKEPLT